MSVMTINKSERSTSALEINCPSTTNVAGVKHRERGRRPTQFAGAGFRSAPLLQSNRCAFVPSKSSPSSTTLPARPQEASPPPFHCEKCFLGFRRVSREPEAIRVPLGVDPGACQRWLGGRSRSSCRIVHGWLSVVADALRSASRWATRLLGSWWVLGIRRRNPVVGLRALLRPCSTRVEQRMKR